MNLDSSDRKQAEKTRKVYHSPELSSLGAIELVLRTGPGPGNDGAPAPTAAISGAS
jgi:hypothetical protein